MLYKQTSEVSKKEQPAARLKKICAAFMYQTDYKFNSALTGKTLRTSITSDPVSLLPNNYQLNFCTTNIFFWFFDSGVPKTAYIRTPVRVRK